MRKYIFNGLALFLLSVLLFGGGNAARQGDWLGVAGAAMLSIIPVSYLLSPTPGPKVPGARMVSDHTGDTAAGDRAGSDVPDHASLRDEAGG